MEYTFFNKHGHEVPVRFRSVLIRNENAEIKQAVGKIEQLDELPGKDEGISSLSEKM